MPLTLSVPCICGSVRLLHLHVWINIRKQGNKSLTPCLTGRVYLVAGVTNLHSGIFVNALTLHSKFKMELFNAEIMGL